jgi:hypothetical protein
MEQLSTNHPVVWEEICMIQQAILAAASQCQPDGGQMCTVVAGNTPMTFVTGINSVTVVNGGSNYFVDTPAVNFVPPLGSSAVGATGTLITNGGNILGVTITATGIGYEPIPATMNVSSVAGAGALLDPLVNGAGQIVNINLINGGTGYTTGDIVTATRAVLPNIAYVDAMFAITSVSLTGEIINVAIINPGSGYQSSVTTIEIVSTLNPLLPYPTGSGFQSMVFTDATGAITGTLVTSTGSGYGTLSPYLVITDPGTGSVTSVTLNGTSVQSISVTEPGTEYTQLAVGNVLNPSTAGLPNPPVLPAILTINVAQNTFGTNPNLYWQVWSGVATNKPVQLQLNSVVSYFKGLGYTVVIQSNPDTGSTISWRVCWA